MKRFYEWLTNLMDWQYSNGPRDCDFNGVTFKEDFGPWKKGDQAEIICFDLEEMTVGEFATDKDPDAREGETVFIKSCEFTLKPRPAPKENTLCQNQALASEDSLKSTAKVVA
jgi:hypothetical protein